MAKPVDAAGGTRRGRWVPAEGWQILLLHGVILLTAAWTVDDAGSVIEPWLLAVVTVGGALFGFALAKKHAPDLVAHLLAMVVGLGVMAIVAGRLIAPDGGWRDRGRAVWVLAERWYERTLQGRAVEDAVLFALVMGITLWLVAYTSAWVLYRRGWLATAITLPGIVVVINLGYGGQDDSRPLLVFVVAACVLGARFYAFRRERDWAMARVPTPPRLPLRFLVAGTNLAVVVALLGWTLPLSARSAPIEDAWRQVDRQWGTVERWSERWLGDLGGGRGREQRGAYSAFGDSFSLGGALELSDTPVVRLDGGEATTPYLVGRRYDRYDGRGWASDVERTFDPVNEAGERYSHQMTFRAGQAVPLSAEVSGERELRSGRITVLAAKDELLLTLDSYVTSSRTTSVQLSWRSLEEQAFDLRSDLDAIPVDLRQMAVLLNGASFAIGDASEGAANPRAVDDATQRRIVEEQRQLAKRFVETSWSAGPDGRATTLVASGQVPVYDDVEAVFAEARPDVGEFYVVTGEGSVATPDQLRSAGSTYPSFVRDRYLPLPTAVTERTRSLARDVISGTDNRFDAAIAIQDYLRETIAYDERIDAPPGDRDVVDYVLFESQRGYCEYYASAMAVMLRSLGTPARIAVGYASGEQGDEASGVLYRERNAHAWVEAYFPGYGWIPFEPTNSEPRRTYGGRGQTEAPPLVPTPGPMPTPETPIAETPAASAAPAATSPAPSIGPAGDGVPAPLAWATAAIGLLVVAVLVAVGALWTWGFRGLSPVGGWYARLEKGGRWLGIRARPATTPREFAQRLGRAVPAAGEPARVVADLYVTERYGGRAATAEEAQAGRDAWRRLRRVLVRAAAGRRPGGGAGDE